MDPWRTCNVCKKPIPYGGIYYVCNVSTCNRPRTGLRFCSVTCWDAHVPTARHRESWAVEERAPRGPDDDRHRQPVRREHLPARSPQSIGEPMMSEQTGATRDVLVVVSKLKTYIRSTSSMNTSDGVAEVLSDRIRELCDGAIQKAKDEGRKTVMARDF